MSAFVSMFPSFGAKSNSGNMMWTPLDPSFKEHDINRVINLSKLAKFYENEYLANHSGISPSLSYFFTIEDYHTANYQNSFFDTLYAKKIKEEQFEIFLGTLPYKVITVARQLTETPDDLRHKINIILTDPASGNTVTLQKNIAEIAGKKITVSYKPATQQDEATINNYGGILKTPPYLVKVTPSVKIGEANILEGSAVSLGASTMLGVDIIEPGMSTETIKTDISAGIYYCIGVAALHPAQDQLSSGLDNLKNLSGTIYDSINTGDGQIGELLHNIAIEYFGQVNKAAEVLEALMHIQNTMVTSAGFVSVRVAYENLFGIPMSPATITGLNLDVQHYMQSPFSITGDSDQRREFAQIQGLNSSFFEHSIMEMLTGIESISAVKALQIANETSIPIYKIASANMHTILPLLTVSQDVKTDIQNAVNAGKEVTISRDNVQLNSWNGVGFIIRDANGAGAYMISSGTAGTDTTQPVGGALMLLARNIAALAMGKPSKSWLDPGSWLLHPIEESFMDNIGFMLLGKGYIPKFKKTPSKNELTEHVNNSANWIFYYSGHGGSNALGNWITPGWDANGNPERVYPPDIHVDNHIAFLNACMSADHLNFVSSFGIDQVYQGKPRDEVFLGWKGTGSWIVMSYVGVEWWRYLYFGDSAFEAAIKSGGSYINPPDPNALKLIIEGKPETKLY